jgi:glycosyl transferase family 25
MQFDDLGIDAVYVVHAKSGYELHGDRVVDVFGRMKMPFEFVSDGDPASFTDERLGAYFVEDIYSRLKVGSISLTYNHLTCYEHIRLRKNKVALVFEDDPFFDDNFYEVMKNIVDEAKSLQPGWIISVENTELRFPPYRNIKKGKYLYHANAGRCAGAYLIDDTAAHIILEDIKTNKCNAVIDWWHNDIIKRKLIRMYWAFPAPVEQGSHNGLLASTISTQQKSLRRRLSWLLLKFVKTHITRYFS